MVSVIKLDEEQAEKPTYERKFVRLHSNSINYGSKLKAIRNSSNDLTSKEDNFINLLAYFPTCLQVSIRSAEDDLNLIHTSFLYIHTNFLSFIA